ncbi:MAG: T9SS type A sorting domain-containing protein [Bacteroidia bacterium]|nr:T9SS type A sorting domain-containing protein [Bacteroidia bacterium]
MFPFHETVTLTINTIPNQLGIVEGTIEIKNILGATAQPPKHFTGNKIKLQRNNLPAGIYFYRLTTKDGGSVNGKFVIN